MADNLAVFGICGWSGAGKTTLIEKMVRVLAGKGIKVAVVKRDVHGLQVDTPGKDSDRFFQAGADVALRGPGEGFFRTHGDGKAPEFLMRTLAPQYDLVLVEGHKGTHFTKAWLLSEAESAPPPGVDAAVVLERDSRRLETIMPVVEQFLASQWLKTPVYGCILVGGRSTRMGRAKHLLTAGGRTWLEKTAESLSGVCDRIILAGNGSVPEGFMCEARVSDVPGVDGPMAGVLSGMRWAPHASWVVAACDMPDLSAEAARWLVSQRRPGVWAVIPRLARSRHLEPLLAYYDFRAASIVESLAAAGRYRLADVASSEKAITPSPPEDLEPAWRNVNTTKEL
jgi:molybdopterin-guanine dinucleotide biosynthesis protein MobB